MKIRLLSLIALLFTNTALTDTPPIKDIFKLRAQNATGLIQATSGTLSSKSCSTNELLIWSGTAWACSSSYTPSGGNASFSSLNITPNLSTTNLYVATTGSDSNNCTSALTPCLTIQGALNLVPLMIPGVYQINIAAGTYVQTSDLKIPGIVGKSGDTEVTSLLKITGASRTTTFIQGASNSTNIFRLTNKSVTTYFDKLTFTQGARHIDMDGSTAIVGDVDFYQYFSNGVRLANGSLLVCAVDTGTKTFTPAPTSTTTSGISVSTFSTFTQTTDLVFSNIRGSGSSAINIGTWGNFNRSGGLGVGNITMTTDITSPPRFGIFVNSFGSFFGGGGTGSSISITGPLSTSTAGYGAFRLLSKARANFVNGQAFVFNNTSKAISLDQDSLWSELNGTYSFTTVTTPVEISHSATTTTTSLFSGATISYVETGISSSIGFTSFGYDDRYIRVNRPTQQRRAIANVDATVTTSDYLIAYTSLTAGRAVTLPTCSAATAGITTSGQSRVFTIKDESGNASVGTPITVSVSGGATINGASTSVINTAYGFFNYYCVVGGTNYFTR